MSGPQKIRAMLDGGEYMAPDQWDDLAWCFQRAYDFAVHDTEGLPGSVIANLRRFAVESQEMLAQLQAKPPAATLMRANVRAVDRDDGWVRLRIEGDADAMQLWAGLLGKTVTIAVKP